MAIEILKIFGDDELVNQWQVVIPPFIGILDIVQVNIRAITVNTPEKTFETYPVHYKTESAEKPGGKQTTDKTISIGFRIDKYQLVGKSFTNWFNSIHNHKDGTASPDYISGVSPIRVPITILKLDANGVPTGDPEVFDGCYITNDPAKDYDYENGGPRIMTYNFKYLKEA